MIDAVVIVQARTSSRRLPGKVLLDMGGLPLAVLAAKRAASCGHKVVLATSNDASDDALFNVATGHGVHCIRGPLDDVLQRFCLALEHVADATPVVRLTADNILPNGDLIQEVLEEFVSRKLDYITTTDTSSGLPYGCAVEVTRAANLRAAAAEATAKADREHVTPWVRRRCGVSIFQAHHSLGLGHLRATIDCLEDYLQMQAALHDVPNLVGSRWQDLVNRLRHGLGQPVTSRHLTDMVLGTVQLGMPYGIASRGAPSADEGERMIKAAISNGVASIDTARAYGCSEEIIGRVLKQGWVGRSRIITKLSPLAECDEQTSIVAMRALAENSLLQSCVALSLHALDTVLLHRVDHLRRWGGVVLQVMKEWQASGRIQRIGASIQTPEELLIALNCPDVTHIQLPCNVLDYRWDDLVEQITRARNERALTIHIRSALLQGLLTLDDPAAWRQAHVSDHEPIITWLRSQVTAHNKTDIASLCLAWARGLEWADGVVVGCDNLKQLHLTMRHFQTAPLSAADILKMRDMRPEVSVHTLNPASWMRLAT